MAIKNFEVLDGILVSGNADFNTNTLFVDATNNRVGVLKNNPATALDITGTVTATTFSGSGASLTSIPQTAVTNLGTDFLRSNANDTYSGGTLTVNNSSIIAVTAGTIRLNNGQSLDFGQNIANVQMEFISATNRLNVAGSNVTFDTDLLIIDTTNQALTVNTAYDATNTFCVDIQGDMRVKGAIEATGDVVAYASDERLKTNVRPIENALDMIDELGAYLFEWDMKECDEAGFTPRLPEEHGILAQELERVAPDMVNLAPFNKKYKTAKYEKLSVILLAAVKELKEEIKEIKSHLTG